MINNITTDKVLARAYMDIHDSFTNSYNESLLQECLDYDSKYTESVLKVLIMSAPDRYKENIRLFYIVAIPLIRLMKHKQNIILEPGDN